MAADSQPAAAPDDFDLLQLTAHEVLDAKSGSAPLGAPLGALITPVPRHATSPSAPSIARCSTCAAAACPLAAVRPGGGGWSCAFCGGGNPVTGDDVRARGPAAAWAEVVAWDAASVETSAETDGLATPPTPAVVIVVDVAGGQAVTADLRRELATALASAPSHTRVALILAGRAVTVVDASAALDPAAGASAATVLPGGVVPPGELVAAVAAAALAPVGGDSAAAAALAALVRAEPGAGVPRRARPRCLGAAVAVALDVIEEAKAASGGGGDEKAPSPRPAAPPTTQTMARPVPPVVLGHVVVLATGAPSRGPGAIDAKSHTAFWDGVAARAAATGTTVDAICIGHDGAAAAPVLTRVATATGGRVCMNDDGATGVAARLAAALTARSATDAVVRLYWTPPLVAVPVAVAGAVKVDAHARRAIITQPAPRAGDCGAVRLDVAAPFNGSAAAIQAVAEWTDVATGARVTRAATRTIAPTSDTAAALAAVRADLTALLLVKAGAARALAAGATEDACAEAEASFSRHVSDAARATRVKATRVAARRWLTRSSLHRLPAALLPLADALYGAARAPAFAAPDPGDRARALAAVLAGGPDAALRAVRPGMYVVDPLSGAGVSSATLIPVPPADLILAACPAALLDCGDTVFIWVAPGAPEAAAVAVNDAATALAASRAPPPHLRTVTLDSAAARAASWRLAPLHRDSDAEAALQAPLWGRLSEAQRRAARELVVATGDPSFIEWCREAGAEPLFDLDRQSFV